MSKHPGPWTITNSGYVLDAEGTGIAHVYTDDPETRVVLLRAAEMWEALREFENSTPGGDDGEAAEEKLCNLADKIEAEIAAAKGTT